MALVFRCDGCGRLEGHDPRNKWQSEKAGTLSIIKDSKYGERDESVGTNKDLCKECLDNVDRFIKGLVKTTTA